MRHLPHNRSRDGAVSSHMAETIAIVRIGHYANGIVLSGDAREAFSVLVAKVATLRHTSTPWISTPTEYSLASSPSSVKWAMTPVQVAIIRRLSGGTGYRVTCWTRTNYEHSIQNFTKCKVSEVHSEIGGI